MFVDPLHRDSPEYIAFWNALRSGKYQQAEYRRFGKGGKEIWIQASYNPITDKHGHVKKVIKFATDITAQKLRTSDYQGQLAAIGKSQAVIEFNPDGTILLANENFLGALGYSLADIVGQHHSMFVEQSYKSSAEYRNFWDDPRRGQYQSGEFKRVGKGGREVWIQATYNPIFDSNGKPFKVVKYATDITHKINMLDKVTTSLQGIAGAVGDATVQSSAAAAAAQQTLVNVQAVASGAEELDASVKEIAQSMTKSRPRWTQPLEQVASANTSTENSPTPPNP